MYNEPQKCLYIDNYLRISAVKNKEARCNNMRNFFERLQDIELHFDKDFAMFNYDEIKTALPAVCRRSVKYQKSVLSGLRGYVEWCIDNGLALDFENRLIGITPSDIDVTASYRMSLLKDEAELNLVLDTVLMPMQEDTSSNRIRAILHLLFNGVPYNDIFELKNSQVDLQSQIIHLQNRDVKISCKCRAVLQYVMEMHEFFATPKIDADNIDAADDVAVGFIDEPGKLKKGVRKYSIVKTGHVIENSSGNRDSISLSYKPIISVVFAAIKKANGNMFSTTAGDVVLSGIFSRIFEEERDCKKVDLSEYLIVAEQDDGSEYGMATSVRNAALQYEGWKKAFGLDAGD